MRSCAAAARAACACASNKQQLFSTLTSGGAHGHKIQEASVGRKRDRDSESASAAANTGDKESPNLSDSPGGTPVGTPGLVPQKKPRLTFGGGLRAISASQALEKKKLDPNSPATPGPISSPHPTSGDGGNAFAPPGDSQMSPLGGPAAAPDSGASLSLGAAAIEVQKSDKPRLVFPAAAKIAPPTEEKPKPKLTFGGGLSGAVPLKSSAPIAASSGLPEPSEPVPKPAGSSGELQWPAAASSSSASLAASGASHASLPQHRPSLSKPQLSQVGSVVGVTKTARARTARCLHVRCHALAPSLMSSDARCNARRL